VPTFIHAVFYRLLFLIPINMRQYFILNRKLFFALNDLLSGKTSSTISSKLLPHRLLRRPEHGDEP
jgi:hypothetical protein